MAKNKEKLTRNIKASKVETREAEGGKKHITGVIPYDKEADLGYFVEVIRKGAFTKTIQESDVRALWAHNTQYVLGRTSAGTFSLEDREDGLHFDVELPATSWAGDVFETVQRGDAPGVSFGFSVIKDAWTVSKDANEPDLRELLEVQLYEVSVGVAFPAYPDADSTASTRSLLSERGIDIDRLAAVFARAKRSTDCITQADAETVHAVISALEALLPDESREQTNTTEQPDNTTGQPEPSAKPEEPSMAEEERMRLAMELEIENAL